MMRNAAMYTTMYHRGIPVFRSDDGHAQHHELRRDITILPNKRTWYRTWQAAVILLELSC